MKKLFFIAFLFLLFVPFSFAQSENTNNQQFYRGEVVKVLEQGEKDIAGTKNLYQILEVKIPEAKGNPVQIEYGINSHITKDQLVQVGSDVIVSKTTTDKNTQYAIYDFYRLNYIFILTALFCALVILIGGIKGFGSILGMLVSLATILVFIVPNILKGADPLTITILGSLFILLTSTYLAHGISIKTTIALISTLFSLIITAIFAVFAVSFTKITGLGNEEFVSLQYGATAIINIKGLFLSAIIISTLGALNDITTSQAATILELREANEKLKAVELFRKGLNVGKEHIASLVNTLILAYAGSAFAVFIFLILNPLEIPYWVILNNEIVSDEVVKIIAGSAGLLLSVPIVTAIAAFVFTKRPTVLKSR